MEHKHGEVRRYAAYSLAEYGSQSRSAVPKLTERLSDEHMGYMAAYALGAIGTDSRSAIPRLTQLLGSSHAGARAEAALALSRFSPIPRDTVAAIQGLSTDREIFVRDAAQKSLQIIRASSAH
jgi:HEAT repeat protein